MTTETILEPRDPRRPVGFIRERVMDVVGELAVNADRLQLVKHGVAGSFEHEWVRLRADRMIVVEVRRRLPDV